MNKALTTYIRETFDGQTDRAFATKALNDSDAVYQLIHSNECGFWEWALDIGAAVKEAVANGVLVIAKKGSEEIQICKQCAAKV